MSALGLISLRSQSDTLAKSEAALQIDNNFTKIANALAALGFSKFFETPQQTITAAGAPTPIPHGLSRKPVLVVSTLVCVTSELGYTAGDRVSFGFSDSDSFTGRGVAIVADAVNINIRFASPAVVFNVVHFTTGVITAITNANWKLVVGALG